MELSLWEEPAMMCNNFPYKSKVSCFLNLLSYNLELVNQQSFHLYYIKFSKRLRDCGRKLENFCEIPQSRI